MKNYLRKKAFINMSTILPQGKPIPNSILILFDSSNPDNEKKVMSWLRKHKDLFRKKMLIGVELKNPNPKPLRFPILGKKDISWYNCLKPNSINRVKQDFIPDVLLVLNEKSSLAIDYFAQAIPANLKISHNPVLQSAYNLILDSRENWSILLNEIDSLLPKMELV